MKREREREEKEREKRERRERERKDRLWLLLRAGGLRTHLTRDFYGAASICFFNGRRRNGGGGFPTNDNALLANFLLSSDAKFLLISAD